jgi:hypothetical protein
MKVSKRVWLALARYRVFAPDGDKDLGLSSKEQRRLALKKNKAEAQKIKREIAAMEAEDLLAQQVGGARARAPSGRRVAAEQARGGGPPSPSPCAEETKREQRRTLTLTRTPDPEPEPRTRPQTLAQVH